MIRQILMGSGSDVRAGDWWRWAWDQPTAVWRDHDKNPAPPEPSVWIARPAPDQERPL
jgi:hypothetical protein